MNSGTRHELKIDGLAAVLLTILPLAYENFDLPHSKAVGRFMLAICFALVIRMFWISWRTLVSAANITFKEASAFTWWRRQVIRFDIAGLHSYLSGLGIPIPDEIPPVTVHEGGQAINSLPPVYRGELQIPRLAVKDRKVVTHIYAVYVLQKAFPDPGKAPEFWNFLPHSLHQMHLIMFYSADLRRYFHASYWNAIRNEEKTATIVLWRIRETLGRAFADKLASQVYRVVVDSFTEVADSDFHVSLTKALKLADGIVEAYRQRWPRIQKILDDNHVEVMFRVRNQDGQYFEKTQFMRIPYDVLKTVCFLCIHKAESGEPFSFHYAGLAFFISIPSESLRDVHHMYLVTAKHNVEKAANKGQQLHVRINRTGGGVGFVPLQGTWFYPQNPGEDVAVFPWGHPWDSENQRPADLEYRCFHPETFALNHVLENEAIGIGDELTVIGLFSQKHGSDTNHPIVRSGHLSAMPDEPFLDGNGRTYQVYLAEVRSIGGLLGSPVLVMLDSVRRAAMSAGKASPALNSNSYLLGLVRGNWDIKKQEVSLDYGNDELNEVKMGFVQISPIHDVMRIVMSDEMKKMRREHDENIKKVQASQKQGGSR